MALSPSLKAEILRLQPFIDGIINLFHPLAEASVHELGTGRIIALYNPITQRRVGDVVPLRTLQGNQHGFSEHPKAYQLKNHDGRELKCTSIPIRSQEGVPLGLLCFNVDTTLFKDTRHLLDSFLQKLGISDKEIISDDLHF